MITKAKLIICIAAVIFTVITADLVLPDGEKSIYDTTVRLHILANSDSEKDQNIKLEVRDAIIRNSAYLEMITDTEELEKELIRIATDAAQGQSVRTEFGKEYYETREYDGVMFPAGTYTSLRIIIGEGEGKNWWCVLFPPLCLSAATAQDALESTGMSEDAVNVFTKTEKVKYKFRFRILEILGSLTKE